jgi:hypothetical protein
MAKPMDTIPPKAENNTKPGQSSKSRILNIAGKYRAVIFLLLILIISIAAAGIFTNKKISSPIPHKVTSSLAFPVYYPSQLPSGYTYDKDSAKTQNGMLFFTISNKQKKIAVSEQPEPKTLPDFKQLQKSFPDLKKSDTDSGQAIYGVVKGRPVGLLLTHSTLVNISGINGTSEDVVANITKNMGPAN